MSVKKVISRNNFRPRPPVIATALAYLFLDHYNAPGWVWGATATLYGLLWLVFFIMIIKDDYEEVDILKDK